MIRLLVLALVGAALVSCGPEGPRVLTTVAPVFPRGFAGDDAHQRFFEVRFELEAGFKVSELGLPADAQVSGVGPSLDACRDDRFFVHFPARDWGQPAPADFDARLRALLGTPAWWFRGPDPDLDPRPKRDLRWLRTHREAQCHVIDALRLSAAVAYGLDPTAADFEARLGDVAVGRVCEFTGQVVESAFDGPMSTWHQGLIDPRGLPALPALPQVRPQRVDLHLLDSGLAPDTDLTDVTVHPTPDLFDLISPEPFGPPTPHGDHMVRLMKQITGPSADLDYHMWRVLDERGKGTPHDLARALFEIAAHAGDDPFPQVLNLSLGWPSDFGQPRLLWTAVTGGSVPACGVADPSEGRPVYEHPVGEAVRHALAALHRHNAQGHPVVTFASTGNVFGRPGVVDPAIEAQLAATPTPDACANPTKDWRSAWFYPAEWGFVPTTCEGVEGDYAVVPVGAVDALGAPARMTRPGAEPAFVAPGEQVVVRTPGGAAALSGTSVATALYSAAAARLQVLSYHQQQSPLRAYTLARLLYLTGRGLSQPEAPRLARNPGDIAPGVRLLSVCQAEATLACRDAACPNPGCPGSGADCAGGPVDCIQAAQLPKSVASEAVVEACGPCIEACLAAAALDCAGPFTAPVWAPAGYAEFDARLPEQLIATGEAASSGGAPWSPDTVAPFETDDAGAVLAGPYALGSLGPQPLEPPCPSCAVSVAFEQNLARPTAWLRINPALPGRVRSAWLLVQRPDGAAAWASLSPPSVGWAAGGYYKVGVPAFGADTGFSDPSAWAKAKVVLWAHIEITSGKGTGTIYADASPLYLDLP